MGRTSKPHAGQWDTLLGSSRISGYPYSQAWSVRASDRPIMSRRVSSLEPSSGSGRCVGKALVEKLRMVSGR